MSAPILPSGTEAARLLLGIVLALAAILGFAWGYEHLGPFFNQR